MHLETILKRVEERLQALSLTETAAAKLAGHPDAIKNLRRAAKGKSGRKGISTDTLFALAPVLQTTPGWLLDGSGQQDVRFNADFEALVQILCYAVLRQKANENPDIDPKKAALRLTKVLLETLRSPPAAPVGVDQDAATRVYLLESIDSFDKIAH